MITSANVLSNAITQKVMNKIVFLCQEVNAKHGEGYTPNYIYLRSEIEEMLHGIIKELSVEYKYSPMEVDRMADNQGYWNHVHGKLAQDIGQKIFDLKLYNRWDFESANNYFGSKEFRVFLLDAEAVDKLDIKIR